MKYTIKLLCILATTALVSGIHIHSCTVANTIALTFDDGPSRYTNELIDKLNKYNIKATFFINAHNYYPYADEDKEIQNVIKKAYKSGHQIASHTYEHYLETEPSAMKASFTKMDNWIKSLIGVRPRYFRAPGGNCDDSCIKRIENMGYRVIKWDVDTNDWDNTSSGTISILKSFFNKKAKNYLILLHDSLKRSVEETVPWIINSGILKKYKFVTVAECLGDKAHTYREGSGSSSNSNSNSGSSSGSSSNKTNKKTVTGTVYKTKTLYTAPTAPTAIPASSNGRVPSSKSIPSANNNNKATTPSVAATNSASNNLPAKTPLSTPVINSLETPQINNSLKPNDNR